MRSAPIFIASNPPQHCLSIDTPPTERLNFASKLTIRAGFPPAPNAFETISSSTADLSIFASFKTSPTT